MAKKSYEQKKKELAGTSKGESYVHPDTVKYMKKHKQGMFSAADKKAVKENTPPKY